MGCGTSYHTVISPNISKVSPEFGDVEISKHLGSHQFNEIEAKCQREVMNQEGMLSIQDAYNRENKYESVRQFYTKISETMSLMSLSKTAQAWMKSIREPAKHMPIISEPPEEQYALEYAYGYRSNDTKQNIIAQNGKLIYTTATVIIEMTISNGIQKIYGGGENIDEKSVPLYHSDDILCIGSTLDKKIMASAQIGKAPSIIFWDMGETLKVRSVLGLPPQCTGVNTLCFSADGKYLACASVCSKHTFFIIDVEKSKIADTFDGHYDKIFEIAWSKKPGDYTFIGVGILCIKFYTPFGDIRKYQYGQFKQNKVCNFTCATYDENGIAYSAGTNGKIYVWEGASCTKSVSVHIGTIHCIFYHSKKIFTGATDNKLCITNAADMTQTSSIDLSSCPRAIDIENEELVIGLRDGSIIYMEKTNEKKILQTSHSEGELCGLAIDGDTLISAGEDNKILAWDYKSHKLIKQTIIDEIFLLNEQSTLPPQNCSRALGINLKNHHLAVGTNNGVIQIRESAAAIDNILNRIKGSKKPISILSYSPDGELLAAGSYDSLIYIYQVNKKYNQKGTLAAHKGAINGIDWSTDCQYIRSNSNSNEVFYWSISEFKKEEKSDKLSNIEWETSTCKLTWECTGLFPQGTEPGFINSVSLDGKKHLLICGNEWGSIFISKNPSKEPCKMRIYNGHSESAKAVLFSSDSEYFFSVGGYDHTLFQWKRAKA